VLARQYRFAENEVRVARDFIEGAARDEWRAAEQPREAAKDRAPAGGAFDNDRDDSQALDLYGKVLRSLETSRDGSYPRPDALRRAVSRPSSRAAPDPSRLDDGQHVETPVIARLGNPDPIGDSVKFRGKWALPRFR
jgi:hypothetical protein